MPRLLQTIMGIALGAALCPAAAAQIDLGDPESVHLTPVDQAVGDLDPRAVSLREVQVGLRTDGEATSLFELVSPDDVGVASGQASVYYRVAPGFRARTSRMDYMVLMNPYPDKGIVKEEDVAINIAPAVDGAFIEMTTPATVYDLRPMSLLDAALTDHAPTTQETSDPSSADHRINRRLNLSLDTQGPLELRAGESGSMPVARPSLPPQTELKRVHFEDPRVGAYWRRMAAKVAAQSAESELSTSSDPSTE